MRILLSATLLATWIAGCAPANREKLVQEVLQTDPRFAEVLERHRELASRIETYKREFALKRSTVEQKIAEMRKDLGAAAASVRQKTADARKRLEPDRQRLKLAIAVANEELRAKGAQRASLGRTMARVKKALASPKAAWSDDERARQDAHAKEMLADATRLDREMETIQAHLRLLKTKLLLIQL